MLSIGWVHGVSVGEAEFGGSRSACGSGLI